jgi:hypothetical protein
MSLIKISHREYVHNQAEKEAGVHFVRVGDRRLSAVNTENTVEGCC